MYDAVHPHIRGAYDYNLPNYCPNCGSSPHTWGIRPAPGPRQRTRRFIPTYVGHTRSKSPTRWAGAVHPHIRGAYYRGMRPVVAGSRPRPVHPHIRGAYTERQARLHAANGSSPHTWGIRKTSVPAQPAVGFIPTYVGHTLNQSPDFPSISVHPHIRGAYSPGGVLRLCRTGSSPHTWGIQRGYKKIPTRTRFIPTYVGHTLDRRKKNGWFQPLLL